MLARRYRVIFLGRVDTDDPHSARYITALEEMGIEVQVAPGVDVADVLGRVGLCVFFEFFNPAERMLGRVRILRPELPVVVDSVDVHFAREGRGVKYAKKPWLAKLRARRTKKRELRVYRQADLVLTVTENDRAEILRELPAARVGVIPNIHEVQDIVPRHGERKRNSALFVGGFAHSPNTDAVLFFCREVLPLVRRVLPDLSVTVVGAHPPKEVVELGRDSVVIAGWVPEVRPYLESHCVAIAPLRFGAGMKGKVGEALAAGLPVVTTSVGAEGMNLEDGKTALIADSPEAFAIAVVRLCSDAKLHAELSEAGRLHVRQRWGVAAVEEQLIEVIEGLRTLRPESLGGGERIKARVRDVYVRAGLARKIAGAEAGIRWYICRVRRIVRRSGKGNPRWRFSGLISVAVANARAVKRRVDRAYWTCVVPVSSAWRGTPADLQVTMLSSLDQFQKQALAMGRPWEEQRKLEQALGRRTSTFKVRGYCYPCQGWRRLSVTWAHSFSVNGEVRPNWREQLVCPSCGLNNRMRAALHLLTRVSGLDRNSRIYVTEQTTPLFRWLRTHFSGTVGSEFLGSAVPLGEVNSAGIRNEDLTRLTFSSEQFDGVLCFEVFEHVPNYRQAFWECARVLKPSGHMLFSAPFDAASARNVIRARVGRDGVIEHLLPPEYHGDPLNTGGILAFQSFGWEMVTQMRESGFRTVSALLYHSNDFGYLGADQIQFLATK
jgi:glycosyltransferase involved in cell wall biosynthesis/SAM-dependent methyltransferase